MTGSRAISTGLGGTGCHRLKSACPYATKLSAGLMLRLHRLRTNYHSSLMTIILAMLPTQSYQSWGLLGSKPPHSEYCWSTVVIKTMSPTTLFKTQSNKDHNPRNFAFMIYVVWKGFWSVNIYFILLFFMSQITNLTTFLRILNDRGGADLEINVGTFIKLLTIKMQVMTTNEYPFYGIYLNAFWWYIS